MSVGGEDFSPFVPTPPGWLEGERILAAFESIKEVTRAAFPSIDVDGENPQVVLENVFHRIDEVGSQADQQKVWDAWKVVGGSTVGFDVIATRLAEFLNGSFRTSANTLNPDTVNLGPPARLEEDLLDAIRLREHHRDT